MLSISTDFESGNIGAWDQIGPHALRFKAPSDGALWGMWFYFRMAGHEPGPFEFVVDNWAEMLEATHWGDVRPLMRVPDGEWLRARDADARLDVEAQAFRFCFDLPDGPVEIAYSYPYPPAQLTVFLDELKQFPGVEISYPGTSAGGRPIPYVILRCLDAQAQPEIVWATTRMHAGEVPGSYVMEGFLRALASSPLRQFIELHVLPMVDVDAVAEGRYGKDAPPADHFMVWTPDSPRSECRLGFDLMQASAARGPIRLYLDFHAPSPENDSYLPPLNPTLLSADQRLDTERLINALVSSSPITHPLTADEMLFQRVVSWHADDIEQTPAAFLAQHFGATVCLVETAYFASRVGTPFDPVSWARFGESVASGVEKHLLGTSPGRIGVYDSMPPVYHQTRGWILWSLPFYTRADFTADTASVVGDDPGAQIYLGAPRLYPVNQAGAIRVQGGVGGSVQVVWMCYDASGARLFPGKVEQEWMPDAVAQPLAPPADLPAGTALLRPNFRLAGSFRPFRVDLPDTRH